jgi:hypothetical protein
MWWKDDHVWLIVKSSELSRRSLFQGIISEISRTHEGKHHDWAEIWTHNYPNTFGELPIHTLAPASRSDLRSQVGGKLFFDPQSALRFHVWLEALSVGQHWGSWCSCDVILPSAWTPASTAPPRISSVATMSNTCAATSARDDLGWNFASAWMVPLLPSLRLGEQYKYEISHDQNNIKKQQLRRDGSCLDWIWIRTQCRMPFLYSIEFD